MRMEIKLDVLISVCTKQRKPWPRISWVGQEKEAVFLLDDRHINEINLSSGKTKKKIPGLQSLLKNVVVLTTSVNGAWLAGILKTGELFLWNKDQDCLKIEPAVEEPRKVVAAAQECLMKLYLYVSGDGRRVLLTTPTACVFLWESTEHENTSSKSSCGCWTQVLPDESVMLPSVEEKETGVHAAFIQNEILGDCCLCSFVFYSGECLMLTFLVLRWHESSFKYVSSFPYQIHWIQQTCSLVNLVPQCVSVKSRGALLCAFARDGLLLAVAVNQIDPKATQVLFLNTLTFVTVSGSLKGCSSKNSPVPLKIARSYWVGDMSWTPDSLFLACMLKRGSLILLTSMGELLTMVTSGCSVEFGPAEFIPFHPRITYRQYHSFGDDSGKSLGSSASESDLMRQRFSVASHSRLPYLIVSDGYMITVLRFPNSLSPSGFISSLLLDSTQQLENICQNLLKSKSKGTSLSLQSLLSLKASLLRHAKTQTSIFSTIPKFLEEDVNGISEKTMDLLDYEDELDDGKQFYKSTSSFNSQRFHSFIGKSDRGHLEFASIADTIHAKDNMEEKNKLLEDLYSVQKNLLAAWQIGISKNIEEKDTMLNYTVNCIIHFFNIFQFVKCSVLNQDASLKKSVQSTHWMRCVLEYFQQCLTVLCGHSGASLTRHVTKLTSQTLKLILRQQQDQLFSKNLLACFRLLKMVTRILSSECILQYEKSFASPHGDSVVELDSLTVPFCLALDQSITQQFSSLKSLLREPPPAVKCDAKTEKRLIVLWQFLCKKVIWYQMHLSRKANKNAEEESIISSLLSHIQATIQSSGGTLEQHLKINSLSGEEKFLLGSYRESLDIWKKCLCEVKAKGGKRMYFLQSRYYLAILFCHLYQYNLCEAQGLCDHLVGEILRRSQLSVSQMETFSDAKYFQHELWMVENVDTETAVGVIQSMARFMAAYFTNQPLYIFPPHNIDILPPVHIKQDLSPRIIPLQHSLVTKAVRDQNLSSVWTAEYALDLFFIGGLIPEAVWLTHRIGDWKLSLSIGVAYQLYCQNSDEFSRLKNTDHQLKLSIPPLQIFEEKLKSLLGQPVTLGTSACIKYKQFTDPIEEEDTDVLYSSVQELLKAAVMADADILSETFQLLMDSAKDLSRKLYGVVPDGLYLPAPPLYCPQPASLSEEDCKDILLKMEKESRQKVSGVLQRIILLLQAAHCFCPAAQWYLAQLKCARKVMQKIRTKGSQPSLSPFPETLCRYSNFRTVFYRSTSSEEHQFDGITCQILGWFRELCALCWMLHVRERLTDNCRRYQTARENITNHKDLKKNEYDASTVEHCLNAVEWACRMLPFCRFMNVEELVQDIILSLLGELPSMSKVAEIFVKAFPNPEDVRVPLRDKYHGLQQRLKTSTVKDPENEDIMSDVIEAAEKVRIKALRRVVRNIGPIEINIWEPAEEGAADDGEHCYDRLSLSTTLSRSTITDLENPQECSDASRADTLSDALFTGQTRAQTPSLQRENEHQRQGEIGSKNTTHEIKPLNGKTKLKDKLYGQVMHNQSNLPVVGTWEFERDDDEYVNFLELFLSYVLERDLVKNNDLGIPFLTTFSELLRERELNSLFFDAHTTLKWQGKTSSQSVFRAGSCYTVSLASCDPEIVSVYNENQNTMENPTIVQSIVQRTEPACYLMKAPSEGLFGLKNESIYRAHIDNQRVTVAPASQTFANYTFCSLQTQTTSRYVYKTVDIVDIVPGELAIELTDKLGSIAKLLEWMIRWSDKRLLCGSNYQDSLEEYRPVIHLKTSAAAVLTSLWLLQKLCRNGSQAKRIKCKSQDNQCLEEFASLSGAKSRIKEVSSTDEGSSILASPPLDVWTVQTNDDFSESDFRMSAKSEYSDKKEINHGSYSVAHMTNSFNEVGPFVQEKLDITLGRDFFEEPYEKPKSSSSSFKVKPLENQRGKQVSISDTDSPKEGAKEEKTKAENAEQKVITDAVTGTVSHVPSLEQDAKVPCNAVISVSDIQPPETAVSTMSSGASRASICGKKQEAKKEVPAEEKLNTSETVRQMLQDEMFKLVQLQQINFMSLMQIVQSSFANVPNVQQSLQQHQSVLLEVNQPAHSAEDSGSLRTQLPTKEVEQKLGQKSSGFQPSNSLKDENINGHRKNHLDVNVSLSSLENHSKKPGSKPLSQDSHSLAPTNPLDLPSSSRSQEIPKLIPIDKNVNYSNGFPLLKLESGYRFKPALLSPIEVSSARPPSVPRVAWSSSASLWNHQSSCTLRKSQSKEDLSRNIYDPKIPRQMHEEEKRWADTVHKEPPTHLILDQHERQQKILSCQLFPAGIPLLRLQLDQVPRLPLVVRQPVTATLIPVKPAIKDIDCKGISLLHADLPQKKKAPKLILLQDLIAFEQHHQDHHPVPSTSLGQHRAETIQLLKTDVKPLELRDVQNSRKRQKRRDKKQVKEKEEKKKPSVFCPEDSTISISDTVKDQQAKSTSYLQDVFLISMDKTGEAVTASADLRYVASIGKKTVDTQDASTNTHQVLKSYQDVGVSTGNEVSEDKKIDAVMTVPVSAYLGKFVLCRPEELISRMLRQITAPQEVVQLIIQLHLLCHSCVPSNSVPVSKSSSVPEILLPDACFSLKFTTQVNEGLLPFFPSDAPDLNEHEYISVVDMEDSDILNNLPMIPESVEETDASQFEIPFTAKLHHVVASVTSAIPPEVHQKKDDLENVSSQVQKEGKKSDSAGDSVTWNLLHKNDRIFPASGLPSELISKEYFSTKELEMDMQLQALQNVTENIEKDFRNTEALVKLIEEFEAAANSDHGAHHSLSEDARIDGDEKGDSNLMHPVPSYTRSKVHSLASSASASDFPSGTKSSSGMFHIKFVISQNHRTSGIGRDLKRSSSPIPLPQKDHLDQVTQEHIQTDSPFLTLSSLDPVQITGQTGVTDFVSDLVVENNISLSELDITKIQAKEISRIHNYTAGHSQKTEKEKKEIQVWMKKKQKERMKEYVKTLNELRQKEHNPFNRRKNVHSNLTSKDIKLFQKKKEEKDKALLSEHHSIRISEALSLMNGMLSETVVLATDEHKPLARIRSPQEYRKRHVASTKRIHLNSLVLSERSRIPDKPSFGKKVHRFTPAPGLTQSRAAEYRVSRTLKQKPPRVATAVQTEGVEETDRDIVSPWTVPDDIQRMLEDSHDSLFQASLQDHVSFSPLGIIDTDDVSESTGSILSKLDWNAVEAMVADVEDM